MQEGGSGKGRARHVAYLARSLSSCWYVGARVERARGVLQVLEYELEAQVGAGCKGHRERAGNCRTGGGMRVQSPVLAYVVARIVPGHPQG